MKVAKPLLRTSISLLVLLSMCYELALSWGHQASLEKAKGIPFYDSNAHSRGSNDGDCWLQPYVDFHADAVQSLRRAHCVPSLVYVCDKNCGGVGDRMSGIISAFYLAVALDRVEYGQTRHLSCVKHAIIEQRLLSRTRFIYTSYYSSFSEISIRLSGLSKGEHASGCGTPVD